MFDHDPNDGNGGIDLFTLILLGGGILLAMMFGGNGNRADVPAPNYASGSYNTTITTTNTNTTVCAFVWDCGR